MKYILITGVILFSSVSFAGEGWHSLSENNPHAKGGCASKKDKVAQMHKFHGKDWKKAEAEKKVDNQNVKPVSRLKDYI
ncbi:MAG: hypothetical protein OEM38_00275 [Gammaproteobacteria bacterium]|nr:hypothetical protein [Gammaproteobacteria bacterium]